jgi:hypothetical protein
VHFFFAGSDGEGFTAGGRNQVKLGNFFVVGILVFVATAAFAGRGAAFGKKCDPAAVG